MLTPQTPWARLFMIFRLRSNDFNSQALLVCCQHRGLLTSEIKVRMGKPDQPRAPELPGHTVYTETFWHTVCVVCVVCDWIMSQGLGYIQCEAVRTNLRTSSHQVESPVFFSLFGSIVWFRKFLQSPGRIQTNQNKYCHLVLCWWDPCDFIS